MATSIHYPIDVYGARSTIDFAHHELHEGNHYTSSYSETVGTATACMVLLTVPADCSPHFVFNCETGNSGTLTLSEAPNASGGSAITTRNNDRNSTNSSSVTTTSAPTYVSAGTILETHIVGTNNSKTQTGASPANRNEWILKEDTLYLLRFIADNASTKVSYVISWYETEE